MISIHCTLHAVPHVPEHFGGVGFACCRAGNTNILTPQVPELLRAKGLGLPMAVGGNRGAVGCCRDHWGL